MGKHAAAEPPSSLSTPSQEELLKETKIPRRLFRIQSKQRELLDSANSWAQNLSRNPQPGVNLPPEVLENLRNFHKHQRESANPSQVPIDEVQDKNTDVNQQSSQAADPASVHGGLRESSPATVELSWEQSPSRELEIPPKGGCASRSPHDSDSHSHARSASMSPGQQQDAQLMELDNHSLQDDEPFASQEPIGSPLQPTLDARSTKQRPAFTDFPPSSLDTEEPLEIVPPGAVTEDVPPVNKPADLDPTPPSAQIQVPCTFETDSSVETPRQKQVVKRPYHELASLQTVQRRIANSKQKAAAAGRTFLAQKTGGDATDIVDSQSSEGSASSIIPATNTMRPDYSPPKSPNVVRIKSIIDETPYIPRRPSIQSRAGSPPVRLAESPSSAGQETPRRQSPEYRPASPRQIAETNNRPASSLLSFTAAPAFVSQPEAPFIRYSLSYPSYTGSVGDFVRACIYIKVLQRKRALASYQYDDFIRAWVKGYLPYIETLGESDKPLTAIEWYMETVDEPEFTAKIVTKDSLGATLEFYTDEVKTAQLSLGVSLSPSPAEMQAPPPPKQTIQSEAEPRNLPSTVDGSLGFKPAPRKPLQRSRSVQEPLSFQQPEPISQPQPEKAIRKSPVPMSSETEAQQPPLAVIPSTPVVPSSSRKRPADDDVGQSSRKRTPADQPIPSEGSSRSRPATTQPESSRPPPGSVSSAPEPKKADLEKKAMQWKKYLARRKTQRMSDTISIASSAPPRSGQRE